MKFRTYDSIGYPNIIKNAQNQILKDFNMAATFVQWD